MAVPNRNARVLTAHRPLHRHALSELSGMEMSVLRACRLRFGAMTGAFRLSGNAYSPPRQIMPKSSRLKLLQRLHGV